jgi:hypothetical protein
VLFAPSKHLRFNISSLKKVPETEFQVHSLNTEVPETEVQVHNLNTEVPGSQPEH